MTREPPPPEQHPGAAVVDDIDIDFVASVIPTLTLLEQVRLKFKGTGGETPDTSEVLLVSSPGFGVLDSGCGRTIVGVDTLRCFEQLWRQRGWPVPERIPEVHQFKFGNGALETSQHSVQMPVTLAGKRGVIRAAIIKGDAPLLLSRTALKSLGASLDFQKDCLRVFDTSVPLQTNSAGQYVINLVGERVESGSAAAFTEVMTLQPQPQLVRHFDIRASAQRRRSRRRSSSDDQVAAGAWA